MADNRNDQHSDNSALGGLAGLLGLGGLAGLKRRKDNLANPGVGAGHPRPHRLAVAGTLERNALRRR
ncbi:LPXTG cell wall anchor domain-containing protein, partial [Mycobacterium kansasii]